jgi:crotonobetainyl-CoA:carnitine CoA-transferase CaiB-like acyl-CoA transferase
MSLNGTADMAPLRAGIPISDTIAGLYTAFGILAALRRRDRSGRGDEVQVAMVDGLISMFTFASGAYFATGDLPPRTGNDHMVVAPYGVFQTSDGPLAIAPSTEKNWLNLCRALDMEDARQDPRFATNQDRLLHREAINRIVAERIATRSRDEWIELLNRQGVPCGPINNLREVFSDPQVLHQQMLMESPQPSGRVKMPGFAVKVVETPARLRRPSPQIGEHTDEVLAEAGFDRGEIEKLRSKRVI